jgi:hypothetical protein
MRFVICDVFIDRPLAGNQLAVFPDASGIPELSAVRVRGSAVIVAGGRFTLPGETAA